MSTPRTDLSYQECLRFLTMPHEQLLFAQRKHWIVLVMPYVLLVLTSAFFFTFTYFFFVQLLHTVGLAILMTSFIVTLSLFLAIKLYVDWFYQIYIVTSRKIVEVDSFPLFSHVINDLLLDQVRITEIDTETHGLAYQLFDIGDVKIDYDRYSHGGEFILRDIRDPDKVGQILSHALGIIMQNTQQSYLLKRQIDSLRDTQRLFTSSLQPKTI